MSFAKYKILAYTHEQNWYTDLVVLARTVSQVCKVRIFVNPPGSGGSSLFRQPEALTATAEDIANVATQQDSFATIGPKSQWYDYKSAKGAFENAQHYAVMKLVPIAPEPPTFEPAYIHFVVNKQECIAELNGTACTGVANLTTRHFDGEHQKIVLDDVTNYAGYYARTLNIPSVSEYLELPEDCTICRYVVPVKESGQRAYRELSYKEARRLFNAIKFEFNNPQAPKPKERNMTTDNKEALTIMQLEGGATIVAAVYASDNTAPTQGAPFTASSYHFKNTQQLKLEAGDLIVCETQDTFKILTVVDPDVMVTDIQCQLSELKHVVAKVKSDEYRQIKEAENRALRKLSLGAVASKLDEYKKQLGGNLFEEAAALLGVDPSKNAATNKEDFEAGVVIDAE